MRSSKRLAVLLVAVGLAVVLAAGTALAAVVDAGPGDNTINGTENADTLNGNDGNDTIQGWGGNDEIDGGDGADKLYAYDDQGTVATGDDRVLGRIGNDRIEGGSGADTLHGGVGNDTIMEGPQDDTAVDRIYGADGDDTIYTGNRTGTVDVVDCGAGRDEVLADPTDEVNANCERLLPNRAETTLYSTETSQPGDVIPTSESAPAGTEVASITVEEEDVNGNVLATYQETYVAGEPDTYTKLDESREGSEIVPAAGRCREIKAVVRSWSLLGLRYEHLHHKYFCYNGGNVWNVRTWANFRNVGSGVDCTDPSMVKWGYYWSGNNGHGSYRKGRCEFYIPIHGGKYHVQYPWSRVWVRANGSWDAGVGLD